MIAMVRGTVWTIESDKVVLDVGGVGYLLHVPVGYLKNMKYGDEKTFYTHLLVREDDFTLVGFYHWEEKALFLQLLGVNGVGPKAALAILSMFEVKQIKAAIVREDASLLTEVPGIGAKIAKRLILELKEKMKDTDLEALASVGDSVHITTAENEVQATLLALGFSRQESREALAKIEHQQLATTEDQIKEALRLLATSKERVK